MNINFDEELFNPLRSKLDQSISRFNVSYGSAGSGKSFTQAQHEIIKCLEGNEKTLIIRKYGTTLKDSVVSLVTTILDTWGLQSLYTHNKSDQHIRFINGSEMLFKGFDDPEKIKSIAGITRVWIEEATELTKDDFNQINLRVRGRENLQITLTFNPIDEDHWLKSFFFDTPETRERTTILHTTYQDNRFIDEAYKKELESYQLIDPNYYKIYALGLWGGLTEGRIFTTWEEVDDFPAVDGWVYGLDFGFSNDPTAIVKVLKANERIYLDEVCYQTGLTNSDIAGLLKSQEYAGELVICDSAEPKSVEELRRFGINTIGADKGKGSIMAGIDNLRRSKVLITRRSTNIRKENKYYQWATKKDGTLVRLPKDFQNHCFDKNTLIATSNGLQKIKDITVNDLILTSYGYEEIISNGITGYNKILVYVIKFNTFEVELRCTNDHLIYTSEGWKQISSLAQGSRVFLNKSSIIEYLGCIREKITSVQEQKDYIDLFGSRLMGKYLKDFQFTTKMKTRSITQLIILNLLKARYICQDMEKSGLKKIRNGLFLFRKKVLQLLQFGMQAKKEGNGIDNTQLNQTLGVLPTDKGVVKFATNYLRQTQIAKDFVQTPAKVNSEDGQERTILSNYAKCAEAGLHLPNIQNSKYVQLNVVESICVKETYQDFTWDVTMKNHAEFLANGILVHNCMDATRYALSFNLQEIGKKDSYAISY